MWPMEREVSQLPEIEELKVGMSLDASGVESGAQRAEKALEGVADTAEQSGERSASGISEINRAILEASRMVTAQMKEISRQLGTATQSIQQTGQAVSGIGERLTSAGAASKKAAQGTKEVDDAMQALGLSAQISDRRMAEINEEMQTLADQKRVMESQGYGLGFADYDRIIQRMNELKTVQAEYRKGLTQPAIVNVDTSRVTNLSAQLKQAQDDLRSLASAGFGFGDTNYDEQYQEVLRLTQAVKDYKAELAQPEAVTPYQAAVDSLFEARAATDQLRDAFRGVRDVGAGALAAVMHPIRSLNVTLGNLGERIGQVFSDVAATVRSKLVSGLQMAGRGVANVAGKLLSMSPGVSILRGIVDRLRGVKSGSDGASGGLARMVRQIRNINIAGMAMRGVTLLFGQLRNVVQEYLSQNQAAQNAVNNLKSAFANALAPAINIAINALSAMLPVIQAISNAFATLVTNLFGSQWTTISGATGAASAVSGVASATRDAAAAQKEYNNEVYGFDQITKQSENSSGGGGSGGSGGSGGGTSSSTTGGGAGVMGLFEQFSDFFQPIQDAWNNVGSGVMASIQNAFDTIKQTATDVGTSFANVWNNGTGQRYVESLLTKWQSFVDVVNSLVGTFDEAWTEAGRGESVIQAVFDKATAVNNLIGDIGRAFTNAWNDGIGERIWGNILDIIKDCNNFVGNLATSISNAWNTAGRGEGIWNAILTPVNTILEHLHNITSATAEWAANLDFGPLLDSVRNVLEAINPIVDTIGGVLEDIWTGFVLPLGQWLTESGLPTFLDGIAAALTTIGDIAGKVVDTLKAVGEWLGNFKWNGIEGLMNGDELFTIPDTTELTAELSAIWAPGSEEAADKYLGLDNKQPEAKIGADMDPGSRNTLLVYAETDDKTPEAKIGAKWGSKDALSTALDYQSITNKRTLAEMLAQYSSTGDSTRANEYRTSLNSKEITAEMKARYASKTDGSNITAFAQIKDKLAVADVSLRKNGWKTVSDLPNANMGGAVNKVIGLSKNKWTTLQKYVNSSSGGDVSKLVGLSKNKWTSLQKYVGSNTGGAVNKPVGVTPGWKGDFQTALGLKFATISVSATVPEKKKLKASDLINKDSTIQINATTSGIGKIKSLATLKFAARGGIVDAATLFGGNIVAGEAGKEAIIPLENHTEWLDKVADRIVQRLGGDQSPGNGRIVIENHIHLDGKEIYKGTYEDIGRFVNQHGALPFPV